jgi:hypothetical protein
MGLRCFRSKRGRRHGFTITDLLVAMALITLIMSVLSQAFVEGLNTFRQLKGIGDLQEQLRPAAIDLRDGTRAGHSEMLDFARASLAAGSPDPKTAGFLRIRYQAIGASAEDLEIRLGDIERQTTNPVARRLIGRMQGILATIKAGAATVVQILDLLSPPPPPPPSD